MEEKTIEYFKSIGYTEEEAVAMLVNNNADIEEE